MNPLEEFGLNPKAPVAYDSSMLKDFVDCPSKFYLRHILGLRRRHTDPKDSAKFDWGTCWHHVIEAYHRESDPPEEGNLVAALETLEDKYPEAITPASDKYKRSKERMIKQLFEYDKRFKSQNSELEILRHEQFFDVYNEEEDLRWIGRIDSLRRRKRDGRIVVWDYKTSSSMGPLYFDQHELGFQFPGYVWAANQMFTEEVQEITVDVMYTISRSYDFFRRTFRYDAYRRKEWVNNVKMIVAEINRLVENHLYEPDKWIKNWNECTRYGRCSFFDVHNIHPKGDTRLKILTNDYVEDRWDPRNLDDDND